MLKRLKRKIIRRYKKQLISTCIAVAAMSGIVPQTNTAAANAVGGSEFHVIKEIEERKWKKESEEREQKTVSFENFPFLMEE